MSIKVGDSVPAGWLDNRRGCGAHDGTGTDVHDLAEKLAHGQSVEVPEHLTGYVEAAVANQLAELRHEVDAMYGKWARPALKAAS